MGLFLRLFFTIVAVFVAKGIYQTLYHVPKIPNIPEDNYWGPGKPKPDNEKIVPFKVNVPQSVLDDLKQRLSLDLRVQPSLEGVNFEYGFHSEKLKEVVEFWRSPAYDWRNREKMLNALPQFKTQISGLDLHFIHVKPKNVPKNVEVVPLLLLHGWPGSVKEFYKLIPLLTSFDNKDMDFVFEVISPSLPGFAFSEASHKPGLSPAHMAAMFKKLMTRLGHDKFYVQGGDWGSLIATNMAILYPDKVTGIHLNMCGANTPASNLYLLGSSLWPSLFVDQKIADHLFPLSDFFSNLILEMGYMHIQASKPDTVGVALSNSPAGLAAYILEKFSTWTDPSFKYLKDGGLDKKYLLEDLLDNVMLYWVNGAVTSSLRIYAECFSKQYYSEEQWDSIPVQVPTFCAQYPNELIRQPDFIVRLKYPELVSSLKPGPDSALNLASRPPRGGHFAAFEEPGLTALSVFHGIKAIRNHNKIKQN